MSLGSLLGDDVDHAVYRVGAPHRSSRTADHFNPSDVFEWYVLCVPVHAAEKRAVNGTAVDKNKKFVGELKIKSARTDGPGIRVDLCYIQSWYHSQQIRDVGCTRAA